MSILSMLMSMLQKHGHAQNTFLFCQFFLDIYDFVISLAANNEGLNRKSPSEKCHFSSRIMRSYLVVLSTYWLSSCCYISFNLWILSRFFTIPNDCLSINHGSCVQFGMSIFLHCASSRPSLVESQIIELDRTAESQSRKHNVRM